MNEIIKGGNKMYNKELELFEMIGKNSVRNFLKATPYPAGDSSALDNFFSKNEDLFFNSGLYVNSDDADAIIDDLENRINKLHNNLIVISGYKGCGKTTFIHKYIRKLTQNHIRHIIFNFDEYGSGDPIRFTISRQLYKKVYDDLTKNNGKICHKLLNIWNYKDNHYFLENTIDLSGEYKEIIDMVSTILTLNVNLNNNPDYLKQIKTKLFDMNISNMLVFTILFDISYRVVNSQEKKCIIIFDNLDVIYNSKLIDNFTRSCSQFYNDAQFILRNITYNDPPLENEYNNPIQNYNLIFVMRENTNAQFIEHFTDRNLVGHPIDISDIYNKSEIVNTRCSYIIEHKSDIKANKEYLSEIQLIKRIFEDEYIENYLFKLFNEDIRTGLNAITEITFGPNYFEDAINIRAIINLNKEDKRFASRGIIFFEIFKLFAKKNYFDTLKHTEYLISLYDKTSMNEYLENEAFSNNNNQEESGILAINISRIILQYLFNSKRNNDDVETYVSLRRIYDDMQKLAYNNNSDNRREILNIVNQSLLDLFELRTSEYWNHLVTFDEIDPISYAELTNQLDKFLDEGCDFRHYGSVRITTAGYLYLNTVLTHFEYFSARIYRCEHYVPLFLEENLRKCSSGLYIFEKIIKSVLKDVKICWSKLKKFYVTIFQNQCKYRISDFLGSKFVYHGRNDDYSLSTPLFHIERVVHSHISYLDAFRRYAFYLIDINNNVEKEKLEEKKIINERLTKYIEDYIAILDNPKDNDKIISPMCKTLISNYKKCINKIKNGNKWDDFLTHIDNATGENIKKASYDSTKDNNDAIN